MKPGEVRLISEVFADTHKGNTLRHQLKQLLSLNGGRAQAFVHWGYKLRDIEEKSDVVRLKQKRAALSMKKRISSWRPSTNSAKVSIGSYEKPEKPGLELIKGHSIRINNPRETWRDPDELKINVDEYNAYEKLLETYLTTTKKSQPTFLLVENSQIEQLKTRLNKLNEDKGLAHPVILIPTISNAAIPYSDEHTEIRPNIFGKSRLKPEYDTPEIRTVINELKQEVAEQIESLGVAQLRVGGETISNERFESFVDRLKERLGTEIWAETEINSEKDTTKEIKTKLDTFFS
ncbi:MAG: hypothetical protein GOV15_04330, partial [Candidatus Diapherotrites archaeon]|nr:hypothetical protein [Candidatus Diapherotrites archaeon]